MKFRTKDEAVMALLDAPVGIHELGDMLSLSLMNRLTKTGDATYSGGYYSTTWTVTARPVVRAQVIHRRAFNGL